MLLPDVGSSNQAILVETNTVDANIGILYILEKKETNWMTVDSFPVTLGKNGLADDHNTSPAATGRFKQEGDGCSPAGIFPLLFVFGYADTMDTRMPYRAMGSNDFCIDDIDSPEYNQHVTGNKDSIGHLEIMRRTDQLYEMGIWVGYNTKPAEPGNGSCIFLHIWRNADAPTSGCTAMSETNISKLIKWLDPAAQPVLIQRVAGE
jgi:L,D-peptidoglycan transpeptidase YkuD (ErfK/YbiS/YcfS/YnhG family)